MRALSFVVSVVVTLFAVWPATLLTSDARAGEPSPAMCSSSGCCRPEPAEEAPARPGDQQDEPCPCNPFMSCSACTGMPIAEGPIMAAPLSMAFPLRVVESVRAPLSACLLPVWQPPRA